MSTARAQIKTGLIVFDALSAHSGSLWIIIRQPAAGMLGDCAGKEKQSQRKSGKAQDDTGKVATDVGPHTEAEEDRRDDHPSRNSIAGAGHRGCKHVEGSNEEMCGELPRNAGFERRVGIPGLDEDCLRSLFLISRPVASFAPQLIEVSRSKSSKVV